MPIFFQPCSTAHKLCLASLSHSESASTLPWRANLVNLNLPSTCSKVACRSTLSISQQSCSGPPLCTLPSPNSRNVCWSGCVKSRLVVQACNPHLGSSLTVVSNFLPSVLLQLPVFPQKHGNRHLELLTAAFSPQPEHSACRVSSKSVRGVDSTRWPNSDLFLRVEWRRDLLIPVIDSAVDVVGRGAEQKEGNGSSTAW